MDELKNAIAAADEDFLISMSNKGIYKRAAKDIEGMLLISRESPAGTEVDISGETVTVCFPLEKSVCSCVSRTVCRHIVGALMLLRNQLSDEEKAEAVTKKADTAAEKETEIKNEKEAPEKAEIQAKLKTSDIEKINSCSVDCLEIMGDILRNGIVRLPDATAEKAEVAAVMCHSLKMADGERVMRDISLKIGDCLARRAAFSIKQFTKKFCSGIELMKKLTESDIKAEDLGSFRSVYEEYPGDLRLIPVGHRKIDGGGYQGDVYYFVDPDFTESPFLSLSDICPVFYDTKQRKRSGTYPWDLSVPLMKLMNKMIVLAKAKVSCGKLSSSQETTVVMTKDIDLNCSEIRELVYTDLKKAAVDLYESSAETELERLIFVQPEKCTEASFDKVTQTYSMEIRDSSGTPAYIRVKYRKESRELVELIEKLGKNMVNSDDKRYTILAAGYIENNELVLYPIEIFDFIERVYHDEYELPEEYETTAEKTAYSHRIYQLLDEAEEQLELVLQCGITSASMNFREIENKSFNYGMKGFSQLWGEFFKLSESCRHSVKADVKEILYKMAEIEKYILAGKKRLEIILTLSYQEDQI